MDYETFARSVKALTAELDQCSTNKVIFIEKPYNVVFASIGMQTVKNDLFDEDRTEFIDADNLSPQEIHKLVFDATATPKLIVLNGVNSPLSHPESMNAGLKMVYMPLPAPAAIVVLTEYERGWGSKDFDATPYYDLAAAKARVEDVLSKNTASSAPDYYIVASLVTDPESFSKYERIY